MGHLLDIIDGRIRGHQSRAVESEECEISEKSEKNPGFFRLSRFSRTPSLFAAALEALERRSPDHIEAERWHQAVEDGRRFLAQWGEQAEALGWTAEDLFGLAEPPKRPSPLYRRLSQLDATGLIWLAAR